MPVKFHNLAKPEGLIFVRFYRPDEGPKGLILFKNPLEALEEA